MARARLLKPEFFTNDVLVEMSPYARLLFQGLWLMADREGRLEDRTGRIKMTVFPADDVDVDALLEALVSGGLIQRYEVDGDHYISIPKFTKHQKIHPREAESSIPPPPEAAPRYTQGEPRFALGDPRCPEAEAVTDTEAEAVCVGDRAVPLEAPAPKRVTQSFLERMRQEFSSLDVDAEWEKASNHRSYDKAKDKQRYFQNWLKRAIEYRERDRPPTSKTSPESNILPWAKVVS